MKQSWWVWMSCARDGCIAQGVLENSKKNNLASTMTGAVSWLPSQFFNFFLSLSPFNHFLLACLGFWESRSLKNHVEKMCFHLERKLRTRLQFLEAFVELARSREKLVFIRLRKYFFF